jgi:peptidoglycan biosynthesis protein MviN/MurJ (putative lipid II flippase)
MLLILTIPSAVALALLAPIAAWLVHLSHVLSVFTISLTLYAVSIPFESVNHLLLRSFYALKRTVAPAVFSVVNGAVAILVAWFASPVYGVYALALGFTAGQIVQLLGLSLLLPSRVRALTQGEVTSQS